MFKPGELYTWGVDATTNGGMLCIIDVGDAGIAAVFHDRSCAPVLKNCTVDMQEAIACVMDGWWRKLA